MLSGLLLLLSVAGEVAAAPTPVACVYASQRGLQNAPRCAWRLKDRLRITLAVQRDLRFERGLASIGVSGRWWYRRRDGRAVEMLTFDNGPDPFSEGLARGRINGQLVYVDRRLRVRLRLPYTFGTPFKGGQAEVCTGCVEERLGTEEHSAMTGGSWMTIDRSGRRVVAKPSIHGQP